MNASIISHRTRCNSHVITLALCLLLCTTAFAADGDAPAVPAGVQEHRHHVTGLFDVEREADLRDVIAQIPDVEFVSADFKKAEAVLKYDQKKLFGGAKPEQVIALLDNMVRNVSRSTFTVKPARTTPDDKLEYIEIPVEGLDCKGCSFAAYQFTIRIEGVEVATASFKLKKITALFDPQKTNRAAIEKVLQEREVHVTK